MDLYDLYRSKCTTVEQALQLVEPGDCIATGYYGNFPQRLMDALHTIGPRVPELTVWLSNPQQDHPFMHAENIPDGWTLLTTFYSPYQRVLHGEGRISYVPYNLHSLAPLIRDSEHSPNVFFCAVNPPDEEGRCYMPAGNQVEAEQLRLAEKIILEINPRLPHVRGAAYVTVEQADAIVEADYDPPYTVDLEVSETERRIAAYVAEFVPDGATLQLGIGSLPCALSDAFMQKNDLGIHTEMLVSSFVRLLKEGVVTNRCKTLHRGESVFAFTYGSQELYDYIDNDPTMRMMPVAYVNDPYIIAQNDNMISVNAALEVDLSGQICSESIGHRHFSGSGGAMDFAFGAFHSKGGRGIVALHSTAKNGTISRIRPCLTTGAVVTIPRTLADVIVTEYGVAYLRGASLRERAERLIAIAHPDFRDELRDEAQRLMLW